MSRTVALRPTASRGTVHVTCRPERVPPGLAATRWVPQQMPRRRRTPGPRRPRLPTAVHATVPPARRTPQAGGEDRPRVAVEVGGLQGPPVAALGGGRPGRPARGRGQRDVEQVAPTGTSAVVHDSPGRAAPGSPSPSRAPPGRGMRRAPPGAADRHPREGRLDPCEVLAGAELPARRPGAPAGFTAASMGVANGFPTPPQLSTRSPERSRRPAAPLPAPGLRRAPDGTEAGLGDRDLRRRGGGPPRPRRPGRRSRPPPRGCGRRPQPGA